MMKLPRFREHPAAWVPARYSGLIVC